MKKGFVIMLVVIGLMGVSSCSEANPIEDDSALTRGGGVNDSKDNTKGGIQVDTIWEGSVTIGL